jgi:hypothetical protein
VIKTRIAGIEWSLVSALSVSVGCGKDCSYRLISVRDRLRDSKVIWAESLHYTSRLLQHDIKPEYIFPTQH